MARKITRMLGALVLLGGMATAPAANAGGSPAPPWNPANEIRIYFSYNPDLLGRAYLCFPWRKGPCTPAARAQALVDYLNSVLRATGANVKAVVAGTDMFGSDIHHGDALESPGLDLLRQQHRADTLFVVNATPDPQGGAWGQANVGTASEIGALGWFSITPAHSEFQTFAHEMGHALGAMHDFRDNAGELKPAVFYAVGWRTSVPGRTDHTLMYQESGTTLDRFSDDEQWHGDRLSSVARYLREQYGRYRP
jgi:hypothetical protein